MINPHIPQISRLQRHIRFNMWLGIFGKHLIGPLFYNNCLTAENYRKLFEYDLEEALDNLTLGMVENCRFQQRGARAENIKSTIIA